jgi:hypothetical protein
MLTRQDDDNALRLLIAQRRLYRRAKRWLGFRWLGMLVIALAAPVISVIWPQLAVATGAVAGVWLFVGRTLLEYAQSAVTAKAAAIQERFDFYVFGMPSSISRSDLPSPEDIASVAGPDSGLAALGREERLYQWYPISENDSGLVSVAISQRANAAYAGRLLSTTALVWAVATAVWTIALVIVSVMAGLSLVTFLAGVLLPLLPAFLDVAQYLVGIRRAARDRDDLARSIEGRLRGVGGAITPDDLLVWQARLYELRRSTPDVPDLIYKLQRKANERAMHSAARQLGAEGKRSEQ